MSAPAGDASAGARDSARLVAVTGASGFIGTALVALLEQRGDTVIRIGRSAPPPGTRGIRWDPERAQLDFAALEGVHAVFHLAGENIGQRWSIEVKRRIRDSRLRGTELLAGALARLEQPPAVLVSQSATGYYGERGDEELDETSGPGTGFLAGVVVEWEAATGAAREAGVRVVIPRTGVVLHPSGGALERLLTPFRLGVGGPIGDGKQWMSWISRPDLVELLYWLSREPIDGPVNAVTPTPVRNAEFASTLGAVLNRPALLPTPVTALKLLFGEMAEATILASHRVLPHRALQYGFSFRHPTLEPALEDLLK